MTPDTHNIAQQKAALHALIDTIDSPEKLSDLHVYATTIASKVPSREILERLKKVEALAGSIKGPSIPIEALSREVLYDE